MDDFNLLVGKYLATLTSLADGEASEMRLDSLGRLIISGRFLEDSAHTSGDAGINILAVRNDTETSLVDTDGDYAPLQVDSSGRLKVATLVSVEPSDAEFAEDSAHSSGDTGLHMLAVRQDTLAASTDTDGDYSSFKVNASGELYIADSTARTSLASIDSEIQSITHAEDSAHTTGDVGVMSLAVRNDSDSSLADTDGDYAPFQVDSSGRLKTAAQLAPIGSEAYTVTDALAAAGDGLETITAAATPWVTVASLAVGAGTTAYVYGYQWACDQNAQVRLVTDDTVDTIVYKTDVNSSANPGNSEHWSESGRIEIPGALNLEVRLQIKKRIAVGGNANGTGSMHIRTV